MKKLLLATDFSASASNAMKYALSMAKTLKLEVCVMHAISTTEGVNNSTYAAIFIDEYHKNKREALKEWAAKHADKPKFKNVKVTTLCEVGSLKKVISDYVKHHIVELVVLGVTGSTGITGIVGSNASMVVSKIKVPTLIVPSESQFSKTPVITLATDFETRLSAGDVNALNEMVKAFESDKIQVVNVTEEVPVTKRNAGEKRLKGLFKHAKLDFNYINSSNTLNGIMDFIETNKTDIICLVRHHHNILYRLFTRSTINQVMNKSVKAILVLHE
ncbi:universal stress protein [Mucilaginibacter ginkgonis]|uniref:Universal stress protein n=1 Tax=Mucilaginibacter ginkgonis TaxID=2682091 RepID=A0A6I4HXI9_9SPHI|nr:universal stress protein [Mucilaginibacter ginkgonis]QQL51472.1 universal stress protein [Mucilaginibacter ginkgonis]